MKYVDIMVMTFWKKILRHIRIVHIQLLM